MKNDFVKQTYGEEVEAIVVTLNRKQVEQMCKVAEHFKEIDNFELHINKDKVQLRFTFGLDNDD